MNNAQRYRTLHAGETIRAGDEAEASANPFKDPPNWQPVALESIGKRAPAPEYPAHTLYRRPVQTHPGPLYSIGTWDTNKQAYTPQIGLSVPSFNIDRAQLRTALKELRAMGYSCHRYRAADGSHDDSDWTVLVERTDGRHWKEIRKRWQRKPSTQAPRYSLGTWDTNRQAYTPQRGLSVPSFNIDLAQLRTALKELRAIGYSCHRYRAADGSHDDSDWTVLVERTDGRHWKEIRKRWQRKPRRQSR